MTTWKRKGFRYIGVSTYKADGEYTLTSVREYSFWVYHTIRYCFGEAILRA